MKDALKLLENFKSDLNSRYSDFTDKLEMINDFIKGDLDSIIDDIQEGIDRIEELEDELNEAMNRIEELESELA